jgi:hypothetical protein
MIRSVVAPVARPVLVGIRLPERERQRRVSVQQVRDALGYAAHVAAHLPPAVSRAS